MPGVGFQFALGGTAVASSIQPVLNITVAFTNASTALRWDAIQIPGISNALALIDQYRVVAMSALTTYRGSDLDNGGQIAATLFPGGEAPSITDLYTYDQVSQSPCAYDGALKTGAYTFWKPSDHLDMSFREPSLLDPWHLPYIVTAGVVSDPSQVSSLRLRVPIIYEGVSKEQILGTKDSRVAVMEIRHAASVLKDHPTSYPNATHMEKLSGFLRKAVMELPAAMDWLYKNKSWLIPAATTAGALLL
jgi:hypothetical protein